MNHAITEWQNVDSQIFKNEILPLYQPAILRGLVSTWPAVTAGRESSREMAQYLEKFDIGCEIESFVGEPEINGQFFYNEDLTGFNFRRSNDLFLTAIDRLLNHVEHPNPPAFYAGATSIDQCLPGFMEFNQHPFLNEKIIPNLWVGNRVIIPPHYDLSDNIACVISGRRRFTLFPPEQITNLYVGPHEFTPAGQPVSMVDIENPDLEKYPLFARALDSALTADLGPGDAIYIPSMWWHSVKSLDAFNVLINYWWDFFGGNAGSPYECLVHALLTIRGLPHSRKMAWRTFFDHYIFETGGDSVAHLAPKDQGVLGPLNPHIAQRIKEYLAVKMNGKQ